MGKHKSKKHHKKYGDDEERSHKSRSLESSEKPLKLVLKVGGGKETIVSKEKKSHHTSKSSKSSGSSDKPKIKDHSKKKKKKRSASKERKKHKFDPGSSACPSPASVSSYDKSKKKRERVEMEGGDLSVDMERPIKKIHIKPIEPPPRVSPEVKQKAKKSKEPTALQLSIENLHRTLQRKQNGKLDTFKMRSIVTDVLDVSPGGLTSDTKDIQGFFAFPVNDAIAPGYSRVIGNPMDFSTIKNKIDNNQYATIEAFRDDFYLMCNNATIYNAPETIYYKAAKRLLQIGAKMMSQEKIRNIYRSIGVRVADTDSNFMSDEPIDVDTIDNDVDNILSNSIKKKSKSSKSDTRPSVVGRRILAQVQEAAKRVAKQLKEKHPSSKIGFLRRDKDGSTSLAIINPDSGKESLPVNMGTVVGKVTSGSHVTTGFKEDKKNKATPVSYLMYGPFGSFAPTYDSSRATITKEESDLLLGTYGNDVGVHYAQSIQEFVRDTSSFAHGVVDKLLDVLTDGAHSKYVANVKEKTTLLGEAKTDKGKNVDAVSKTLEKQDHENKMTTEENPAEKKKDQTKDGSVIESTDPDIDLKSLLSLSEHGIDVSFLKNAVDSNAKFSNKDITSSASSLVEQLNSTGRLLEDLQEAQNSRLSLRPGDPLSATPEAATKPSEKEQLLAEQLTDTLRELTSQVGPSAVAEVESIRAAMGVGPLLLSASKDENSDAPSTDKDSQRSCDTPTPMEV